MSLNRYATRQDANAAKLIALARKLGMQVEIIKEPVDCFIAISGQWFALELKNPEYAGKKPGRKREYTDQQLDFIDRCAHSGAPMLTWRTEDDVLACYGGHQMREG